MKNRLLLASVVVLGGAMAAEAISIIKPKVGDVPVYTMADYEWKGKTIFNFAPHPPEAYRKCGQDFFEHEYGVPLDFARADVLKKTEAVVRGDCRVRNGALEILPQKKPGEAFGLCWGQTAITPKSSGVCIGAYNGKAFSQWEHLAIDLEQSAPTSVWRLVIYSDEAKAMNFGENTWTFSGTGRHRFVRSAFHDVDAWAGRRRGLALECLTPESGVKVHSIDISPRGGDVYYRKNFKLGFKPDVAKLSFMIHSLDDYEFYVNGVNVARPTGFKESIQPCNLDIARHLKAGVNTIAIRTRYTVLYAYPCGSEPRSRLILDLFAYDRAGRSEYLGSDCTWKTTFEQPAEGWTSAEYDDSGWQAPGVGTILTKTTAGETVPIGFNPQHMGFLTTKPEGTKYPLFAADSAEPRRFAASYPAGLGNARLSVNFHRADTGAKAEIAEVRREVKDGFVNVGYELKGNQSGPYLLEWELTADGVRERSEDEAIYVGKVDQEMFAPHEIERKLRDRLELVQTIDPVAEHTLGDRFMTADCKNGGHSKVEVHHTEGCDYLAFADTHYANVMTWRLDTPDVAGAYYLEIDVPDDRERTVHVGVAHSVGADYDNCQMPSGSKTMTDCTGAITTGGVQPLTGGVKTLTMAFYAANKISSVVFTESWCNRNPAAVAAIRLYRVRGDLPGMIIPKTERRLMEHHERFNTWQTYATCSHSVEQGSFHPFIYHKNAWRYWYEGIARKIRMLRFKGHNASVEGLYMYYHTIGPDDDFHSSGWDGELFDVPHLISWMYDANGIDCYFGWEQNRTCSSQMNGVERGVSDRKIQRGLDRGIYTVGTNGMQCIRYASSGVNMFAKGVREDSFDAIRRLYNRYEKYGHVKGFFLAYAYWWVPSFPQMHNDDSSEYGFDDDSMDAFTRDTGIVLDFRPDDPDRFRKRHQFIHARHRDRYYAWRREKYEEWFRELNGVLSSGENSWPILLSPNFSHACNDMQMPFLREDATEAERSGHLRGRFNRNGWSTKWANLPGVKNYFAPVGINIDWKWGESEKSRAWSEYLRNDGTQAVIREMGSVYSSYPLAELHLWFNFNDYPWYWRGIGALCSQQRPAGKAAYLHELEACMEQTPKAMVLAGIDCNPYTGQTEECRRFAAGYYAMPERPFAKVASITGIDARSAKGGYLRLYNLTDSTLEGELKCSAAFTSSQLAIAPQSRCRVKVSPYSLIVFKADSENPIWQAEFVPAKSTPDNAVKVSVDAAKVIAEVPGTLYGTGMEDVNHEIYGGLDAQRLYDESFEEQEIEPVAGKGVRPKVMWVCGRQWREKTIGGGRISIDRRDPHLGAVAVVLEPRKGVAEVANAGLNGWGIATRADRRMRGRFYAKGKVDRLSVALRKRTDAKVYAESSIRLQPTKDWQRVDFALAPNATDPQAELAIVAAGEGVVKIDDAYLEDEPTNEFGRMGCREDVVAAFRQEGLTFLRWGGSMANSWGYLWKNMKGDRRPYDGFWFRNSSTGFLYREFVQMAALMKLPCAFSIYGYEQVAKTAEIAEWLKRFDNDIYVQIGNEECAGCTPTCGEFTLGDCRRYCKSLQLIVEEMRKVNPRLKFVSALMYNSKHQEVMDEGFRLTDGVVDYWDIHLQLFGPDIAGIVNSARHEFASFKDMVRRLNPNTKMKMAVFEENGSEHGMRRAIAHSAILGVCRELGEMLLTSCPANALQPYRQNENGWDQGQIFLTPDKTYLQPCAWAQQMAAAYHRPLLLEASSSDKSVFVSATKSRDGKSMVVHFTNASFAPVQVDWKLANSPQFAVKRAVALAGAPLAENLPEAPLAVAPRDITGRFRREMTLEPYSYTVVEWSDLRDSDPRPPH